MKKVVYLLVFAFILFGLEDISSAVPLAQQRYYQPIGTTGVFYVFGAKTLKKGQIGIELQGDFAEAVGYAGGHDPDQNTIALRLGYGLLDKLEIGLDIPYTFWEADSVNFVHSSFDDVSFGVKYRLVDETESIPGVALLGAVTFPTGDEDKGISTGGTDFDTKFIVSKRLGPVNTHLNVGYYWPGTDDYDLKSGVTYGAGMDFSATSHLQILAELTGNKYIYPDGLIPIKDPDPLEVRLGLRFISDSGIIASLGGGVGLTDASPDYRILARLNYNYPPEGKKVIKVQEGEVKGPTGPEVKPGKEGISKEELLKIVLEDVHFEFDKSTLTSLAKGLLDDNAKKLKENPGIRVVIEGHCDERGSREYNIALGERRAMSVRNYLSSLGIDEKKMKTISYGEERPLDPGHNERAWSLNRRAHFIIEIE